jgi:Malectin domain
MRLDEVRGRRYVSGPGTLGLTFVNKGMCFAGSTIRSSTAGRAVGATEPLPRQCETKFDDSIKPVIGSGGNKGVAVSQLEASTERAGFEEERSELSAVLESALFSRAPSLRSFLTYICEQSFEGKANDLKEYSIAVEALGRGDSFDHTQDSIVRVEAHKLRKRLRTFYEGEGAAHEIQIEIPPGQYAPSFLRCSRGAGLIPVRPEAALVASERIPAVSAPTAVGWPRQLGRPPGRRLRLYATAALALAGSAVVVVLTQPHGQTPVAAIAGAPQHPEVIYRISCGSEVTPYVDELGMAWGEDRFFEGGEAVHSSADSIQGAWDQSIFQTRREGNSFSYALPLDPGNYEIRLHFAETTYGAHNPGTGEASRIFDVSANGQRILASFDVLSDAGGWENAATTRVFAGLHPNADGVVRLDFKAASSTAILNAIEVFKSESEKPLPVRLLAGDRKSQVIDTSGHGWGPDRFFNGGRSVPRMNVIPNTSDPSLYSAERYGNFRYVIPVAEGDYTVNLYFAETWWGRQNPGGNGPGSRVFDVLCNGKNLLKDFDVYQAAGGENRAVVKTFQHVKPNSQGRIELSFVPLVNYAFVNAIEVFSP